jgi:hypothetical protein
MNCEICGAPPIFKKGDRVALNAVWHKHSAGTGPGIGTKATVLGPSRKALSCVRLVFDGKKTPQSFHQSFLRRIYDRPNHSHIE